MGKTTVVDTFVAQVGQDHGHKSKNRRSSLTPSPLHPFTLSSPLVARGQCLEQYGQGEAYLPVLAALEQLCRAPGGQQVIEVLSRYAPLWLVQMPALVAGTELAALQQRVLGATRERMLREIAAALEALAVERGLVLVLEDLHVSDHSTVELLAYLAQRREWAPLLIVGTYRLAEVVVRGHALRGIVRDLQVHGQCQELRLELLTAPEVGEYVTRRVMRGAVPRGVVEQIHQRTDGNPLFMVTVVEYLLEQGLLHEVDGQWQVKGDLERAGIPESVQQMIEKQLDGLSVEEQRMLEAASVAGVDFSTAAVAAALESAVEPIEERCAELARRGHFLRAGAVSEWPDGTMATHYTFVHALYQNVLYERMTGGQRVRLHRRIGEWQETAYGRRAGEIALELALHFERGRNYERAVEYHHQAAQTALRRSGYREALAHLTTALALLKALPCTPMCLQQELKLHLALGPALMAFKGLTVPEVEVAYTRARALCEQTGDTAQLFPALWGLYMFHILRGEIHKARALGEQLLAVAQQQQDPVLLLEAHSSLGISLFWLGELTAAQVHLTQGIALYNPQQHHALASLYGGWDPGIACLVDGVLVLWLLGYPDQATKRSTEALTLASALSHPYSLAGTLDWTAMFHQLRREEHATRERAEAAMALATEHGFPAWGMIATFLRGWALAQQGQEEEGLTQLRQNIVAWRSAGSGWGQPYWLALLTEACRKAGQIEEGLKVVAEALAMVEKTGECVFEAELYRLKGELTLQSRTSHRQVQSKSRASQDKSKGKNPQSPIRNPQLEEAAACFRRAIAIARRQEAKSLELRAVMSLSRLWQRQGKQQEAHQMLAEIYGWFTEGFETADLMEAEALLEALSH
jgi:predicted ATPase